MPFTALVVPDPGRFETHEIDTCTPPLAKPGLSCPAPPGCRAGGGGRGDRAYRSPDRRRFGAGNPPPPGVGSHRNSSIPPRWRRPVLHGAQRWPGRSWALQHAIHLCSKASGCGHAPRRFGSSQPSARLRRHASFLGSLPPHLFIPDGR